MKSLGLSHYALTIGAASALLAGCGGSQQPIGAPGAIPQGSGIEAQAATIATHAGHPVAHPKSLTFYSSDPLTFTVRQSHYHGRFTVSDSACNGIASVSPTSAKGPRAKFTVTPIESPSGGVCVVNIADARGYMAKVRVSNPGY
jgi:hypothetical protein